MNGTITGSPALDDAQDHAWMHRALELAHDAAAAGEVPVGAVLVRDGECLGEGWNQSIGACDPTAHAEIMAMRAAAARIGNYRLVNSTLYVTLEPCPMCAGAAWASRIAGVVFGATNPDAGATGSLYHLGQDPRLNHEFPTLGGVMADRSARLLEEFFAARR